MKKTKSLICTLLTIMLLICVFTGCAKSESEESYEASQTTAATTQTTTQTETTQTYDNGLDTYEEETQVQYYHAAIEGCVIEEQDGSDEVHYREKCEACGYVSSSTHTMWHSFGGFTSSFHCPQCGNMQKVYIETSQN